MKMHFKIIDNIILLIWYCYFSIEYGTINIALWQPTGVIFILIVILINIIIDYLTDYFIGD